MLELNEILKDNANYVVNPKGSNKKLSSGSKKKKSKNVHPSPDRHHDQQKQHNMTSTTAQNNHKNNDTSSGSNSGDWFQSTANNRKRAVPGVHYSSDDEENRNGPENICSNPTLIISRMKEMRQQRLSNSLGKILLFLFGLVFFMMLSNRRQVHQTSSYTQFPSEIMDQNSYGASTIENMNLQNQPLQQQVFLNQETNDMELAKRFMQIQGKISFISSAEALMDASSPQFQALDWIANKDSFMISPENPLLLQRYALAVLYFSTNQATKGWKNTFHWLSGDHECNWKGEGGVRKCNEQNEVIDISLWNNLKGTIPSELFLLDKLQVLYLSRNELYGTIPPEIANLKDLTYLGLQHNRLSGVFPNEAFRAMTKLKFLFLEKNDLNGFVRRVDYPCLLMKNKELDPSFQAAVALRGNDAQQRDDIDQINMDNNFLNEEGSLEYFTADCKTLWKWKKPEFTCACCTKCYLP